MKLRTYPTNDEEFSNHLSDHDIFKEDSDAAGK